MQRGSLQQRVIAALECDLRLPSACEVAVLQEGSGVLLRGTVESYPQQRAAIEDARAVCGGGLVRSELRVDLIGLSGRADAEIRGTALQRLIDDPEVPSHGIDLEVNAGAVTLRGKVRSEHQASAAFADVAQIPGVAEVVSELVVVTPRARGVIRW